MKTKLFFLLVFACLGIVLTTPDSLLLSIIWEVNQDGTGDFTTIQHGINASSHGDTVLVYPGTYYENINYNYRNITVASLELTTGNEQYISQTVIDGQRQTSCVSLIHGEINCVLRGFTITNGQGDYDNHLFFGGGISIFGDYPDMVECDIINCKIFKNYSFGTSAGVNVIDGVVFFSGCSIRQNFAHAFVGGVFVRDHSQVTFDPVNRCSVYDNFAGSGLDIGVETIHFDTQYVILDTFTVSVPDRYFAQIFPGNSNLNYYFDILNSLIEPIDHDLYVSPLGNDNNSGLSPEYPLKTINLAVRNIASNPYNPRSIYLCEGTYSFSDYQESLLFGCKAFVNISGVSMSNTIIDAEFEEIPFFYTGADFVNSTISNLTFRKSNYFTSTILIYYSDNIIFENIRVEDCIISDSGAGIIGATSAGNVELINITAENIEVLDGGNSGVWINGTTAFKSTYCMFSNNSCNGSTASSAGLYAMSNGDVVIENCRFSNNTSSGDMWFGYASALAVNDYNDEIGDTYIYNNLFLDNQVNFGRGTIYIASAPSSSIYFSNNTLIDNASNYGVCFMGNMYLQNNILRNPSNFEIGVFYDTYASAPSYLYASYNNIEGGESAVYSDDNSNGINWEEGNIDEDPLFLLSGDYPYQLTDGSPCIDAGTPDTTGYFLPPWDLLYNQRIWDGDNNGEAIIDMGCYEYGSSYASGFISGYVIDTAGNLLENAEISAGNFTTHSNENGEYDLEAVVGTYDVVCYLESYEVSIIEDVIINLGETTVINFILTPEVKIDDILNVEDIQLSNYPNPFNPSTTILFNVTQSSTFVTLEIFNIKGQKVKTLLNSLLSAGHFECIWNGKDTNNKRVSTGEYFAKLKIDGEEVEVKKMMLLK
ncbi:MAG: carboxypeptidase regulatory-like domain-containing protein [Candidatus Cloacimonetes bacterium]|nr:carboxypeptidase regulatory-like domain-containing protein [Candidatus Cloacimonadota bacterium]MCF7867986.1 carboxypeptidase regulatory-like domain-containing protein [Candidatus Cloacimonadota bacterium]MCF7883444.1 carboxypeptidase regulatory-like domain-containing protein [Candidatus Cloacimonadota bacterium]